MPYSLVLLNSSMYLSISTPASSEAQCQNVMVTGCVPSRLSTGAASSSAGAAVGSAGAGAPVLPQAAREKTSARARSSDSIFFMCKSS